MNGDASGSVEREPGPARRRLQRLRLRLRRPLPPRTRLWLLALGWVLLVVGLAGLVLPGIQGILTLLLAAAVLSLASHRVHELLRRVFRGWPAGWRRLLRLRRRVAQRVHGGSGST